MMFLYPLGSGSRWNNNEIRYSLRSLEKYIQVPFDVTIVGLKPSWLTNVQHIPFVEMPGDNALVNQAKKLWVAMHYVPNQFIWMNDDFYVLAPLAEIPMFHGGPMLERVDRIKENKHWKLSMYDSAYVHTVETLTGELCAPNPIHYDQHLPMPMEKGHIHTLLDRFDLGTFRFRSLYGNFFQVGGILTRDPKAPIPSHGTAFYSTRNAVPPVTAQFLQAALPNPSRFEA